MKTIVRFVSVVTVCCMFFALCPVNAATGVIASGTCGENVTWTLYNDGTMVIGGNGKMEDYGDFKVTWDGNYIYDYSKSPWFEYYDDIKKVIVEDGVTHIGDTAFAYCYGIVFVEVSNSVTSIGNGAFDNVSIDEITIPNGVQTIGMLAFGSCSNLSVINLPNSINLIHSTSFFNCLNIDEVNFFGTRKEWDSIIVNRTVKPFETENKTLTMDDCFVDTTIISFDHSNNSSEIFTGTCGENLTWTLQDDGTLVIDGSGRMDDYHIFVPDPDKIVPAPEGSFAPWWGERDKIKKVVLSDSVTSIGQRAFEQCVNLESINLHEGLTQIGYGAFSNCTSLTEIDIPRGVKMYNSVFSGCDNLVSLSGYWGDNVKYVLKDKVFTISGNGEIMDCIGEGGGFVHVVAPPWKDMDNFTSVVIEEGITYIGKGTFSFMNTPWSIEIPGSVTSIGEGAFGSVGCYIDEVRFLGSAQKWNSISIGEDNSMLKKAQNIIFDESDASVRPVKKLYAYTNNNELTVNIGEELRIVAVMYIDDDICEDWDRPVYTIQDNSVVEITDSKEIDVGYRITVVAKKIGKSTVTITDAESGNYVSFEIEVTDKKAIPASYYIDSIPSYYPNVKHDDNIKTNFYNFSGLYVNNFTENPKLINGKYHLQFDVYNASNMYGSVDVYDATGDLIECHRIDKNTSPTSVYDTIEGAYFLVKDWISWKGLSYEAASYSKHTPISVYVPEGGYIKISNNFAESPGTMIYNSVDFIMLGISETLDKAFSLDEIKDVQDKTIEEILKSDKFYEMFTKQHYEITKNVSEELLAGGVGNAIGTNTAFAGNFFISAELDFFDLVSGTVGISEELFYDLDPSGLGQTLKLAFDMYKATDYICQVIDVSNSADNSYIMLYAPECKTDMIIQGVSVEAEESTFPDDAVLKVFRIGNTDEMIVSESGLVVNNYELYNISITVDNNEVQPNGKVKVVIPVPDGYKDDECIVFHQLDDGWRLIESETIDGFITFYVDHFSNFAVAAKSDVKERGQDESYQDATNVVVESSTVLDDSIRPKSNHTIIIVCVIAISGFGVVIGVCIYKRRKL